MCLNDTGPREVLQMSLDVADMLAPNAGAYNVNVARLLAMIWAHESASGKYVRQTVFDWADEIGAWGEWQMEEAATYRVAGLLKRKPQLAATVNKWLRARPDNILHALDWGPGLDAPIETAPVPLLLRLIAVHDPIACVWARLYLFFDAEPVPPRAFDMSLIAKRFWNTTAGKATGADYLRAYEADVRAHERSVFEGRIDSALLA